ncbi:hypothetical protein N7495_002622 [Penicillium taxi]|uniref:uncharacterized protein n=1 Tax=Penicillium taxi TaxID=168475 RepID=UPI0025450A4D|nr:uncharacterized protein N7495_002622 [Penicillium taxi]KAJ5902094.1 hypothetical protein N7495_002622 [Penicillium taxi]
MPVAESCSLAIAAACHPAFDPNKERTVEDREDVNMALMPIQWGAVAVVPPENSPLSSSSEENHPPIQAIKLRCMSDEEEEEEQEDPMRL